MTGTMFADSVSIRNLSKFWDEFVITILKSYSAQMKNAADDFRQRSQKRFKNYFLYITKQILFIRAEHRRRFRAPPISPACRLN